MKKIKVLFLAANPISTSYLKLDEEVRLITEKIRASEHRDLLEFISAWAVRTDDLLQLLNQHKPQIVHFSGHGNSNGEIILVSNSGEAKSVTTQALKALLTTLKDNIQIVVLNACYSQVQAEAIVEVIDCAIGMNDSVLDQSAILFSASFYRALGFGRSVQEAFDQGKIALLLEGILQNHIPELLIRKGVDSSKVFPVNNNTNNLPTELDLKSTSSKALSEDFLTEDKYSALVNSKIILSAFGAGWAVQTEEFFEKFKLGIDYEIDFLIVSGQSFRYDITLIKIESPHARPFTVSGEYTTELNKALCYINDCLAWIEENKDYFLNILSKAMKSSYGAREIIDSVRFHRGRNCIEAKIIIGRRDLLSEDDDKHRFVLYHQTNGVIEITNYDRLLDINKKLEERI